MALGPGIASCGDQGVLDTCSLVVHVFNPITQEIGRQICELEAYPSYMVRPHLKIEGTYRKKVGLAGTLHTVAQNPSISAYLVSSFCLVLHLM